MTESLAEDHIPVFRETLLELLLKIPATVLILAKGRDFALKVL